MIEHRLGDTIYFHVAPSMALMSVDESLRQSFEEAAWRNGNAAMPEHLKTQTRKVVLSTQEMVDKYNTTGEL